MLQRLSWRILAFKKKRWRREGDMVGRDWEVGTRLYMLCRGVDLFGELLVRLCQALTNTLWSSRFIKNDELFKSLDEHRQRRTNDWTAAWSVDKWADSCPDYAPARGPASHNSPIP